MSQIVDRPDLFRLLLVPLSLCGLLLAYCVWRGGPQMVEFRIARRVASHPGPWFAVTTGLSIYLVAVYLFTAPPVPLFTSDTLGYWDSLHGSGLDGFRQAAANMRPLGYGIVLHAIYGLTGSFRLMPAVQSAAYCLSVLTLQLGLWRLTGSAAFAGCIAIVLLLDHSLLFYSLFLMTEELFIALLLLHIGAAALALATRSRLAMVAMACTAVAMVSLKPAGTFVLFAIPILCLLWRGTRMYAARWALVPLTVGMATFIGFGIAVRGIALDKLPGYFAFPYVAYLYDGSGDTPPVAGQAISSFLTPFQRAHAEAAANGFIAESRFEESGFNDLALGLYVNLTRSMSAENASALEGKLATETIIRHSLRFAALMIRTFVYGHIYALESPPVDRDTILFYYRIQTSPPPAESMSTRSPAAFEGLKYELLFEQVVPIGSFEPDTEASRYALTRSYPLPQLPLLAGWCRWALVGFFWITALTSLWRAIRGQASMLTLFAAYTAMLTIGGYTLVAATTVFIPRYTALLDAPMIVTIATGLLSTARFGRDLISQCLRMKPHFIKAYRARRASVSAVR
jgi:hypothetical protein